MSQCEEILAQITFYLDDELQGSERAAFESHLGACLACREALNGERLFLESLRNCRPLQAPAPELRARVEQVLADAQSPLAAPPALRRRVRRSMWRVSPRAYTLISARRITLMVSVIAVAAAIGVWSLTGQKKNARPDVPSDFAAMAVDTHQRHLRGQLPLEINSDTPGEISAWFAGKVPFSFELPNYQESSGQEKLYNLEGARLVGYRNDYAAYVAYQMKMQPISLLVTSDRVARPSGGEEIVSKGITFHYNSIGGLKVITWSDRGLTYALVSHLEERGQQSCIVCHQGTKDQDFIESLKPR